MAIRSPPTYSKGWPAVTEDLRHRYAEALADHMTSPEHKHDGGPAHGFVWDWECCADAVLTVRDAELEQLKDDALGLVAAAAQERDGWRERAEQAELAIARAENLRDKWLAWPEDDMHHAAGLMLAKYLDPRLAAFDDQEPGRG